MIFTVKRQVKGTGYLRPPKGMPRTRKSIKLTRGARPIGAANNEPFIPTILDQGALGSCVWNMLATLTRGEMIRRRWILTENMIYDTISRLFGYYNTRVLQGDIKNDTGCYPHTALSAYHTWGVPSETIWPYKVDKFAKLPTTNAYRTGRDRRSPLTDYWVTSKGTKKVDEVKNLLDNGYLVGICGPVGEEYGNWKKGNAPIKKPTNYNPDDYSGHARVLASYNGDTFREAGSWSSKFGDNGYVLDDASLIEWDETDGLVVLKEVDNEND